MTSRLGTREERDAADRTRRPYDLILRLKGRNSECYFGRFVDPERARQIGQAQMRATRRSDLALGKTCIGYDVRDARTGLSVAWNDAVAA